MCICRSNIRMSGGATSAAPLVAFAPAGQDERTPFLCVSGLFRYDRDELFRDVFEPLTGCTREHRRGHAGILEFPSPQAAASAAASLRALRVGDVQRSALATSAADPQEKERDDEENCSTASTASTGSSAPATPVTPPKLSPPSTAVGAACQRPAFSKVSFCRLVSGSRKLPKVQRVSGPTLPHGAYTWDRLPPALRPPGLSLEENFISEHEEAAILHFLQNRPWDTTLKRRVQHFGMRFDYLSLHPVATARDNQSAIEGEAKTLLSLGGRFSLPAEYDQVTVNEYQPGIGIAPHVETHSSFEEGFCSVSLLGGIVMDFRKPQLEEDGSVSTSGSMKNLRIKRDPATGLPFEEIVSVFLPRRSRVTFRGESRFGWRHGIASRVSDVVNGNIFPREYRISLTYRKVKAKMFCDCAYRHLCNFQNPASMQLPKRKLAAASVEAAAVGEIISEEGK